MADALIAVLGASSTERGLLGDWLRRRALTLFTAQRMFDDYDDVYRRLFEPGSSEKARSAATAPESPATAPASARAMAHAVL